MTHKKAILHIKAIGKFNFSHFGNTSNRPGGMNLSELFWNRFFSAPYLKHFIDEDMGEMDRQIEIARNICARVPHEPIDAIELFFVYNILNGILEKVNRKLGSWRIHLVRGVTHIDNGHIAEHMNFSTLEKVPKNYLRSTLSHLIAGCDFKDVDMISFDVFWPGEISQGLILSQIIKEKFPHIIFILNLENANEQFDFQEYMKTMLQEHGSYFSDIDFVNTTKGAFHELLTKGAEEPKNIFFQKEGTFQYISESQKSINVFEAFQDNLLRTAQHEDYIFGKKYVNIRMYPFKCYYNACFFCTINHGNEAYFPHQNKQELRRYVDTVLDFIEKESIGNVNFIDEAIYPDALVYFMEQVLERNLKFVYRFRARFEKLFLDSEIVKRLYITGARYIGIGLESASPRVNAFVNKGNNDLTVPDKLEVIRLFNRFHIPFHNYAIFGFPQETKEESFLTFRFLCGAIEKMDYYTCTPNIYGLMKGSFIYNHPKKFGITLLGGDEESIGDFLVNGERRDYTFLSRITNEVNACQFTKYIQHIQPNEFWDFIDRSGIFYHFKVLYRKNPYRFHFQYVAQILQNAGNTLGELFLEKTEFYTINSLDAYRYTLTSLITYASREITVHEYEFLKNYDSEKNIDENVNGGNISRQTLLFFIQNFILSNHGKDARSLYNEDV